MPLWNQSILEDAVAAWRAGVSAVDAIALVENSIEKSELAVSICGFNLIGKKVHVVGFGKSGAAMAVGLERGLGNDLEKLSIQGQVNIPDGTDLLTTRIKLVGCRPAGVNLPTTRVVKQTEAIVEQLKQADSGDVCICLVSGGGSALLEMPRPPVTLEELKVVTSFLSKSGADIHEVNAVRRKLSLVKGGGLLDHCKAPVLTLIISDVVGNDPTVIASGPTIKRPEKVDAFEVLRKYDPFRSKVSASVWNVVESTGAASNDWHGRVTHSEGKSDSSHHHVLGDIETAVAAAQSSLKSMGYSVIEPSVNANEGDAGEIGVQMADLILGHERAGVKDGVAYLWGGESTVDLDGATGQGGRNQHLILSAMHRLAKQGFQDPRVEFALVSGGSDAEDGNTTATGAYFDDLLWCGLADPEYRLIEEELRNFNSFAAHSKLGTLFETEPTNTNVGDVRILLLRPKVED